MRSELLFIRKSRNLASTILHVFFYLVLAILSAAAIIISNSWIIGLILILSSKWRIFAVRPRYWGLNLKSNLVDLIVGISFVFLVYTSGSDLTPAHFIYTALYIIWSTIIKPKSSDSAIMLQSLVAIFSGSTAAVLILPLNQPLLLCLTTALLGYGAARHFLTQKTTNSKTYFPFLVALLFAETAWLSHTWLIAYFFKTLGIIIPQTAIILTLLAIALGSIFQEMVNRHSEAKLKNILNPVLTTLSLSIILLLFFSEPIFKI